MKSETRILVSACTASSCVGIVLRGTGVDGAVSGSSCAELCRDAARRGLLGETRYFLGDCPCGLREAPLVPIHALAWLRLLYNIAAKASTIKQAHCSGKG
ncbi:MAG: hypothetical protein GSR80_001718 [Desulfurococcales archaeon]|nr:hypothetical protein [Desulfurococcales archaeon]